MELAHCWVSAKSVELAHSAGSVLVNSLSICYEGLRKLVKNLLVLTNGPKFEPGIIRVRMSADDPTAQCKIGREATWSTPPPHTHTITLVAERLGVLCVQQTVASRTQKDDHACYLNPCSVSAVGKCVCS
jgi:hypothetical protein